MVNTSTALQIAIDLAVKVLLCFLFFFTSFYVEPGPLWGFSLFERPHAEEKSKAFCRYVEGKRLHPPFTTMFTFNIPSLCHWSPAGGIRSPQYWVQWPSYVYLALIGTRSESAGHVRPSVVLLNEEHPYEDTIGAIPSMDLYHISIYSSPIELTQILA